MCVVRSDYRRYRRWIRAIRKSSALCSEWILASCYKRFGNHPQAHVSTVQIRLRSCFVLSKVKPRNRVLESLLSRKSRWRKTDAVSWHMEIGVNTQDAPHTDDSEEPWRRLKRRPWRSVRRARRCTPCSLTVRVNELWSTWSDEGARFLALLLFGSMFGLAPIN